MIKIKNNKEIKDTLNELKKNIVIRDYEFSEQLNRTYGNTLTDMQLDNYYKEKGLEHHEINVSHKLITDMPFNKNINLGFMKKSPLYKTYKIPKGVYEPIDYAIFDEMGSHYTPLVRFDKDIILPMICEENVGWMTPVLFEETTMRPCVNKAKGNILVVGLGIGFFVYNCLLKEDVTKVTVLEYNQDIISLFKEHILPQFNRQQDIEIVQGDAFEHVNTEYIKKFDYTFVDIWRNNSDGIVILSKLLKNINLEENLNVDFWIEDSILEEVKTALNVYLIQLSDGKLQNFLTGEITDSNDIENYITFDKIHRYFKNKDVKIETKDSLLKFVNNKTMLRELLKSF